MLMQSCSSCCHSTRSAISDLHERVINDEDELLTRFSCLGCRRYSQWSSPLPKLWPPPLKCYRMRAAENVGCKNTWAVQHTALSRMCWRYQESWAKRWDGQTGVLGDWDLSVYHRVVSRSLRQVYMPRLQRIMRVLLRETFHCRAVGYKRLSTF